MNKTYIKPLNYYTAAECQTILDFTAARGGVVHCQLDLLRPSLDVICKVHRSIL